MSRHPPHQIGNIFQKANTIPSESCRSRSFSIACMVPRAFIRYKSVASLGLKWSCCIIKESKYHITMLVLDISYSKSTSWDHYSQVEPIRLLCTTLRLLYSTYMSIIELHTMLSWTWIIIPCIIDSLLLDASSMLKKVTVLWIIISYFISL